MRGVTLVHDDRELASDDFGRLVDLQVDAYNRKDLERICSYFAQDCVICTLGEVVPHARGGSEVRSFFRRRFAESDDLHCSTSNRIKLGRFIVDHEIVEGIDDGPVEVVAIYEVQAGSIRRLTFLREN